MFQFIVLDLSSKIDVNNGDKVQVMRFIKQDGVRKEIIIGYMKISSVNPESLYGRGKIISFRKGYSIRMGDLLKN